MSSVKIVSAIGQCFDVLSVAAVVGTASCKGMQTFSASNQRLVKCGNEFLISPAPPVVKFVVVTFYL